MNSDALDRLGDFLLRPLKLLALCKSDPNSDRLEPLRSLDLSIVTKKRITYNAVQNTQV